MDKGNIVMTRLTDIYEKALKYYFSFKGSKANTIDYHKQEAFQIMQRVAQASLVYKQDTVATRAKEIFDKYYSLYSK
jgi:hypothetical protein